MKLNFGIHKNLGLVAQDDSTWRLYHDSNNYGRYLRMVFETTTWEEPYIPRIKRMQKGQEASFLSKAEGWFHLEGLPKQNLPRRHDILKHINGEGLLGYVHLQMLRANFEAIQMIDII